MKKIIINENKRDLLFSVILNESLTDGDKSDKVLQIKDFLDSNFSKANSDTESFDENGNRKVKSFAALLDSSKNVLKLMTDKQLFDLLQEKFKKILPNSNSSERNVRDNFLKKILIAWYNDKITKEGSILEQ
nr:MAG TPA: hypothetical protein [Caudoviricetes sp.]